MTTDLALRHPAPILAQPLALPLAALAVLFHGTIFGFFYAWVCSTMWGLDAADPRVAMAAMQAMNASVRNAAFAPAFFGTPVVSLIVAGMLWTRHRRAAVWLVAAALTYALGALAVTVTINVPMNEALGATPVPADIDAARAIWTAYSDRWQMFNLLRTLVSGAALAMSALAVFELGRPQVQLA